MGKEKKISREDIAKMSREEQMKYEIAQELGLLDQVLEEGWKTLSAKETGRIGGIMNRRRKQKEKEQYYIDLYDSYNNGYNSCPGGKIADWRQKVQN